jgi:rubredoxin
MKLREAIALKLKLAVSSIHTYTDATYLEADKAIDRAIRWDEYLNQADPPRQLQPVPIPMILCCPMCNARHIDRGEFATKPHHTHACQECGHVWRPAVVPTVGVQFLPGFKDQGGEV